MTESVDGFVIGAMLGALFAQVLFLRARVLRLGEELSELRGTQVAGREPGIEKPAPTERAQPESGVQSQASPSRPVAATPSSTPRADAIEKRTSQIPAPEANVASEAPRQWTPPPRRVMEPSPAERAIAAALAWLKRGNPLARIGIVILFFGAVFLVKYAADNSLFPIELRFIALALGAFALLFVGWRLRASHAVYGQLLQGGGVAGLYLTVFAAAKLFQLLPLGLAFGLMAAIALAAAVLAVAQNALALAVIGTAGGFLAPILVSTGSGNHVALFTYYAILNLGIFAVAWFRTWRVLNVLGFLFTFTITGLWRASGYEPADLVSADFFLILFFLMYVGVSVLNSVRQPPNLKGYVSGSLVFGLPVVAFTLHATLVAQTEYALAWSALTLGAFYLVLGWTLHSAHRENFRLLVEAFAALGVIFASLAIPLAFDTRTTAAMWAVEGAGLLWLGVRQERKLARAFGALLQIGAGLGYLAGLSASHGDIAVFNSAYLGALMLGVSGIFSGYWLYRGREHAASYETGAQIFFTLWGLAWWTFGGLNEIDDFLGAQMLGASLAFGAATAALLLGLAAHKRWPLPRVIAAYLPLLAVGAALLLRLVARASLRCNGERRDG